MPAPTPIYLDHNATTPCDRRVVEAMLPHFAEAFGNAASAHALGCAANTAVQRAREQVAALIGADPREVVFTSGATESNNLAIKGVAEHYRDRGMHIVTAAHEHKAVIDPCRRLVERGYEITWLRPLPKRGGVITAEQVAEAVRDDTVLVSIMAANNELGTLNDVAGIGAVCKDRGVLFHSDATQQVGKLPIDVNACGVDLLSGSAHKLYGPKGVGFLFVRRKRPRARLVPLFDGGGHERGMRSGTVNVPGVVGLGAACAIAGDEMADEAQRLAPLRDRLEAGLLGRVDGAAVNGDRVHRLPNTTNISFVGLDADKLLANVPELCASTGAACSSATLEPSYVLRAIGADAGAALGSVRFSLGRANDAGQIGRAIDLLAAAVQRLQAEPAPASSECEIG